MTIIKPMTSAKEMLDLADDLDRVDDWDTKVLRSRAAEALRRCATESAEPVAWRYRHSSWSKWEYDEEKPEGPSIHLFEVEPLYAAPQPAVPADGDAMKAQSSDGGVEGHAASDMEIFTGLGSASPILGRPDEGLRQYMPLAGVEPGPSEVSTAVPADVREEDEINYDDPHFDQGVNHVVDLLAKTIGATDWVAGDGSEDYDEDLAQTLLNILEARGLYNSDDGTFAALAQEAKR